MSGDRYTVEPSIRALLKDLGLSTPRVLQRAGLPGDLFNHRPIELTPEEYYALWTGIADEGAEERVLAVEIGQAISTDLFSAPIFAALASPNLTVAAGRLAAHKPLIGPLRLGVETDSGVVVSFRWPVEPAPPPLLVLSELIFWVAFVRLATREDIRPTRVEVRRPPVPAHRAAIERFLGVRVHTTDRYAVSFSARDAARPFLTENEDMWRALAPDLRRRLHDLDASASVADRVRAVLTETVPAGDPSISAVTQRLRTSSRTLQRQLSAEGTTFQAVLADTRERLARHYLAAGDLSTAEIAYLLGYDDANSFYRAFRSWTGTTPDRMRSVG